MVCHLTESKKTSIPFSGVMISGLWSPLLNQEHFLLNRSYFKDLYILHLWLLHHDWIMDPVQTSKRCMLHKVQPEAKPEFVRECLTNLASFHQQFSAHHCPLHCLHFPISHLVSQGLDTASCRHAPLAPHVQQPPPGPRYEVAFLQGPMEAPLLGPANHRGPPKPPVPVTTCMASSVCFDQNVPKRKLNLYLLRKKRKKKC